MIYQYKSIDVNYDINKYYYKPWCETKNNILDNNEDGSE